MERVTLEYHNAKIFLIHDRRRVKKGRQVAKKNYLGLVKGLGDGRRETL